MKSLRLFPPNLQKEEVIKTFAQILDTVFDALTSEREKTLIYSRIDQIQDEELLDLLAWQFHIEGYELAQSVEEKRNLIKRAIELHRYKGTKYAIKEVLRALGLEGEVKEWFEYGGEPYHFKVYINSITSQDKWLKLAELISQYKNERSWLDTIGISSKSQGTLYVGSKLTNGKHYKIGLHISLKLNPINLYTGALIRKARKTKVGVHVPLPRIEPFQIFTGFFIRKARKITVGVANHG
ncbi:MAG: phage tail protein I [Aquifex sp.]|nr:MAG: phage tail protein I [Aquifex sp.]